MKIRFIAFYLILSVFTWACKKDMPKEVSPLIIDKNISSPKLIFPLNDTIPYLNTVVFKWNSAKEAVKYRFTLSLDSTFKSYILQFNTTDTTYNLFDIEDIMDEKVYWKVQSISIENTISTDTSFSSFQFPVYSNDKPTIFNSTLSYIVENPKLYYHEIKFSKIKGAIGYEILGSHYSDFIQKVSSNNEDNFARANFVDTTLNMSYVIDKSKLVWNDTIYVKIRAILSKNSYSNWSDEIIYYVKDDRDPLVGNYILKHLDFVPRVVDSELVQLTKVGRNGIYLNSTKSSDILDYNKYYQSFKSQTGYWEYSNPYKRKFLKFEQSNGKTIFSGYYVFGNSSLKIIGEKK